MVTGGGLRRSTEEVATRVQELTAMEKNDLIQDYVQVAVCCSVLQCVAECCSVLQSVAVYCSVLQCVAVCCSVLQGVAGCCRVLQCVAGCCSMLQGVAVCKSTSTTRLRAGCSVL